MDQGKGIIKLMKRVLFFISLFFVKIAVLAQQGPVYGQFFHNPFLYNPGFGGVENYPCLSLTHQRQLMGIEGAPVASTLVFSSPLRKNLAVGAKINSESQGLFRNAVGQIALVYVLRVNYQTNLRFGLAGGVSRNQLDLSSATDAQLNYLSHLSAPFNQFELGFGIVFNRDDLKVGVSFPNMIDRNLVTNPFYDPVKLLPLGHVVISGTYRFDLNHQMALEPVFIFERIHSISEQQIQMGSLLHLRKLAWVGGTYKVKSGLSGLFGINIKENISFGYAYGTTNTITSAFNNATHEVQLKIKLGKEIKNEERKHTPRFQASIF